MADSLKILLSTGLDFTTANQDLQTYIDKISKNTKLNLSLDASNVKKSIEDVTKQLNNSTKFTSKSNIDGYFDKFIEKAEIYKTRLTYLETYINKLQQKIYSNNGSFTNEFNNLNDNQQIKMVNALNSALKEQDRIINEINNTKNKLYSNEQTKIQQRNQLDSTYWQQRFQNQVKDMTTTNDELLLMRQYYAELEKSTLKSQERADKEKQVEQILKQELEMFKTQQNLKADSIEKRYGNIGETKKNLDAFRSSLDNVIVKDGQLINASTGATTSFKQMRQELSNIGTVARNSVGFFDKLRSNFEKFSQYLFMGNITMQTVRGIRSFISYVNEMDKYLTNVRIITGQTSEEVKGLVQEYIDLGKELGATSQSVAQIAEGFYRQGKSVKETTTLIKDTVMMSQLSGLGTTESTEYLTSIMNGFKINVNDMENVVSKLVSVDNNAATSVKELAEALSKTSAVANSVGVDLDDLVGYIATVSESTRQDAGSIGKQLCRYVQKCA